MGWLLKIEDKYGNDLYPEIRRRAKEKNATEKHGDMVRYDYIDKLGYYCTESSEHNAEYNPFYIKEKYPELIERFNIPLDEYPRRCINQINEWNSLSRRLLSDADLSHSRTREYASYIMEAIYTDNPIRIGGNVLNTGHLISDFPEHACVEVPCLVDGAGIHPTRVGQLPPVLAAMNMTNINTQLLTIEAARTRKKEDILRAVMLEPRCAAILSIDDMAKMVDELLQAHGPYMAMYR
jgi:alpha-galactosidase